MKVKNKELEIFLKELMFDCDEPITLIKRYLYIVYFKKESCNGNKKIQTRKKINQNNFLQSTDVSSIISYEGILTKFSANITCL